MASGERESSQTTRAEAPKPARTRRKKPAGEASVEEGASAPEKKRRKGVPEASSPEALARMKRQKGERTKPELVLQEELRKRGLEFEVQAKVIDGVRRRADIVLRAERIAIFVDGCFWHACPIHATWPKANAEWWRKKIEDNQRRDQDTNERLEAAGWRVVRVWEHEEMNKIVEKYF